MIRRLECSSFLSLSFCVRHQHKSVAFLRNKTKGRERERNGEEIVDMRNAHTFVICAWLHDQHCFINFISCQASLLRLIRLNIIISQCKNQGVAFSISIFFISILLLLTHDFAFSYWGCFFQEIFADTRHSTSLQLHSLEFSLPFFQCELSG